MNYFSENLAYLRKKNKFSIEELAEKSGIPGQGLRFFENENMDPGLEELIRLSEFFALPVDRFLRKDIEKAESFQSNIRLLVMDIDGVLTDGGMYYSSSGEEIKKFNTQDGRGILNLKREGIKTAFLSSGFKNETGKLRAELLQTDKLYIGQEAKADVLNRWCIELNIELNEVAYIGDDINDLEAMKLVGLSACPADAVPSVKQQVHILLKSKGGKGCVREFIDDYLLTR